MNPHRSFRTVLNVAWAAHKPVRTGGELIGLGDLRLLGDLSGLGRLLGLAICCGRGLGIGGQRLVRSRANPLQQGVDRKVHPTQVIRQPVAESTQLGLDLKGGVSVQLEGYQTDGSEVTREEMEQAVGPGD